MKEITELDGSQSTIDTSRIVAIRKAGMCDYTEIIYNGGARIVLNISYESAIKELS